jgi:hypothetical protein
VWFLNTLEFNRGFYIDTSWSIFEYFKIHKKCQIVLLKPCKVKPDVKILSEGKIVQFALTSPQKYMFYDKSLRWHIPILRTCFLKVDAGKNFINKSANLSLHLICLISNFSFYWSLWV